MDKKESVRLFVAIDLPEDIIEEANRAQHWLKKQNLFAGSYTNTEHAHSTLQFIGSANQDQIPLMHNALQKIKFPSMRAQLAGLNYFAKGSFITVIFLEFICPELQQLAAEVNQQLKPWVEPAEPLISHITLARVKSVPNREKLIQALHQYQVSNLTFTIESFSLKQSELHPEGAHHSTLKKYLLSG